MTLPADDARQGLEEIATGLDRVRTSLAGFFTNATVAVAEQGQRVAAAEHRATIADAVTAETKRLMERRTATLRKRTEKAEKRGDHWKRTAQEIEADRDHEAATREQAQQLLDAHRRSLAAVFALSAETPFEDIREYAARTLNRNGERLLTVEAALTRAKGALQSVRDAEAITDALAAVAEYDGLPPAAARASAMFAAAAETPAAVDAERERDHAIRLAAAEQVRDEAVRVADRATQTLLRIKHAATAAEAWTAIGGHFHMTSTDAGRGARRWRSAAEIIAERHAQRAENEATAMAEKLRTVEEEHGLTCTQFNDAAAARDRFEAAWQNARLRAQQATERERKARDRAERHRQSRNRWTRQALDAEDTVKRVRALLDTHLGPLATKAVREALATPEPITCEVSWHVHQNTAPTTACRRSAPEEG